jgi:hypothetical protein
LEWKPRQKQKRAKKQKHARKLVWAQMKPMLKVTFEAVIKHALKRLADAHGLGLLVRGAEWALAGVRWLQVGEGHRQPLVVVPVPMGSVELDLSVHAGHSSADAQPLITACFAPSSGPDPGVLIVDGCQISPGDVVDEDSAYQDGKAARHAQKHQTEKECALSVEDEGPVVFVHLDLLQLTSREPEPRVRAEALMCLARAQLLAELKQQPLWDELKAAGAECIVYYDEEAKESVWLFIGDTEKQPIRRRITLDAAGRLIVYMIPRL